MTTASRIPNTTELAGPLPGCPRWCRRHSVDHGEGDVTHEAWIDSAPLSVRLFQIEYLDGTLAEETYVLVDDRAEVAGAEACRALAATLLEAAAAIESTGVPA